MRSRVFSFENASTFKVNLSTLSFWNRLRRIQQAEHLAAAEIARIAGVAPSAVQKWKAGGSPRMNAVKRIADHFGVTADTLIGTSSPAPALAGESLAHYGGTPDADAVLKAVAPLLAPEALRGAIHAAVDAGDFDAVEILNRILARVLREREVSGKQNG